MSIKYSIAELKNPLDRQEPSRFYAKAQVREVIDINRVAKEIASSTSLSQGDVLNVIRSIPLCIAGHLLDGDLIDLGDLGRFQFQLKSEGSATRKEFTCHKIKKARLQFKVGKMLTEMLNNPEYEEVVPVKDREETKRKVKNG